MQDYAQNMVGTEMVTGRQGVVGSVVLPLGVFDVCVCCFAAGRGGKKFNVMERG